VDRISRVDRDSVRCRAGIGSRESGAVLVVVVLLMMALFALGHGLLLSSRSALLAARAAARFVETRAAADGAVVALLENGGGAWMDSVGLWSRGGESAGASGAVSVAAAWRRLGPEAWLVEASARSHGGYPVTSARLVWVYDPVQRVQALSAVVSVGPDASVSVTGALLGDSVLTVVPPAEAEMCAPWSRQLGDLYPQGGTRPIGRVDAPRLGRIGLDELVAAAPILVSGTGTPAPRGPLGVCAIDEAWNWGDPDRPRRSCGSHFALRRAEGGLDVLGGVGQGILIVEGDLVFRAGARFYGLVIVGGMLRVLDGATLEGMAVAYGGVEVGTEGTIRGSACWAVRSLAALRESLGSPVPFRIAQRIGPY